jgi:hypothetical protein
MNVTIAPAGGVVGKGDLAYGMIIDVFQPQSARNLDDANTQFIQGLRRDNPSMKVVRSAVRSRVDGQQSLTTELSNDSPVGGQETDVVVTTLRPNGDLLYFVQVAPAKEFAQYRTVFSNVMASVRLR